MYGEKMRFELGQLGILLGQISMRWDPKKKRIQLLPQEVWEVIVRLGQVELRKLLSIIGAGTAVGTS